MVVYTLNNRMQSIPDGVLLLYTNNKEPYHQRLYSTTGRLFVADPLLHPRDRVFRPEAPLLNSQFQVDSNIK